MKKLLAKICLFFMSKEQKAIHDWASNNIETPSVYRLIKLLPNRKGVIGQEYSNYGMERGHSYHYPLFYKGNDAIEFANWDTQCILSRVVENNPEFFELVKKGYDK